MNFDVQTSLRPIVFAVLAVALLAGASAGRAQEDEGFYISVSPNPATTGDPLVVTVNAGFDGCSYLLDPVVVGDEVFIPWSLQCPPPPPVSYPAYVLLDPLPAGIWDIRLVSADLPVDPPALIDSELVIVTDPSFSVRLSPSPATEDDVVVARITGEGDCPGLLLPPEIEEGLIRLKLREVICDPPLPPGTFEHEQVLGALDAGDYLVELYYADQRVADEVLSVLPAGSCVAGETTLCLSGGRFRVEATWTMPWGQSGPARAVSGGDGSGMFWFRNPDYLELVVKVIDVCSWTRPSFWVFIGGATTAGVSIEVTDTATGQVNEYVSPVGQPFESIYQIGAFLDCVP